jgi:hypothetical protein
MDFSDMIEAHKKSGAALTIATIPVTEREAPEFGILKSNADQVITSFVEKPKKEMCLLTQGNCEVEPIKITFSPREISSSAIAEQRITCPAPEIRKASARKTYLIELRVCFAYQFAGILLVDTGD